MTQFSTAPRDRASRSATTALIVAHVAMALLVAGFVSVSSAMLAQEIAALA